MPAMGPSKNRDSATGGLGVDEMPPHSDATTSHGIDGQGGRKAYLVRDLPEDLVEMILSQDMPTDLPDYDYDVPGPASPA